MGEDSEDSTEESEGSDSSVSTDHTVDIDVSGILAAQKVAEEVIQPTTVQSMIEMKKAMDRVVKPTLLRDAIQIQKIAEEAVRPVMVRDMIQMQKIAENAVTPTLAQSIIETQKIAEAAIMSAMVRPLYELQDTLDSALVQLNAPSITADVSTISATTHQKPTTTRVGQYKYPATDIDEVRPPDERIHDKLIGDDGEWYRRRTREISYHLVDYIFWKAKQTGELTDASDEEISVGTAAVATLITFAFTWNPIVSVTVGGVTGKMTHLGAKAAKKRSDRKDLDEKLGSDE